MAVLGVCGGAVGVWGGKGWTVTFSFFGCEKKKEKGGGKAIVPRKRWPGQGL